MLNDTARKGAGHTQNRAYRKRLQIGVADIHTPYKNLVLQDSIDEDTPVSLSHYPRVMIDEYMKLRRFLSMKRQIKFVHPEDVFKYIFQDVDSFIKYLNDNTT